MTIRQINIQTGEETAREYTQDELDAIAENQLLQPQTPTKEQMWGRIKAERDRRVQYGGYFAAGHWYHSDTFSRTQQLGLVMLGSNITPGLQWKTMDNGFSTMTQTLAGQIFAAAAASDQAHFLAAEVHNAAMRAGQEPHLYDYSTGWPPIFEA